MEVKNLVDILLNKRGYLKKGVGFISSTFKVSNKTAVRALYEAKKIIRQEEESKGPTVLKSKEWQLPNGEWRKSIQYDHSTKETNEEFLKLKLEILDGLKDLNFKTKTNIELPLDGVYVEISLPDFHFGKMTGETIAEQQILFIQAIKELYTKVSGFKIKRFILPIGNDLMNSEGLRRSTTKGTPQEDNESWQITFRAALQAVIAGINYLVEKAPVDVIFVSGNHDYERCFYLGEAIEAFYHNNNDVKVNNEITHRKYYASEDGFLIGYTHGDTEKVEELPLIMATEQPVLFSKCSNRFWRLGHLHKHMLNEYRGIQVEFLPALCGSDDWHKRMGYHSNRKALATIFSKNGKEGYFQINKQD